MLETHSTKATAVGESNMICEDLGTDPQPLEANGSSGRGEPLTLRRFYSFFSKNAHF